MIFSLIKANESENTRNGIENTVRTFLLNGLKRAKGIGFFINLSLKG